LSWPLVSELSSMLKKQNNRCKYCNQKIGRELGNIHLDHIIPLAKDGMHSIFNVQWLCETCNLKKGASIVSDPSMVFTEKRPEFI